MNPDDAWVRTLPPTSTSSAFPNGTPVRNIRSGRDLGVVTGAEVRDGREYLYTTVVRQCPVLAANVCRK